MFGGEYSHSIDVKGRLTIPAKFRNELGLECVVSRGFEGCLNVHSIEGYEKVVEDLTKTKKTSKDIRMLQRQLFGNMANSTYDKQGRILIPVNLRDLASLSKEVMVIGVGDHVELWDKDKWQNYGYMDDEKLAALADGVYSSIE